MNKALSAALLMFFSLAHAGEDWNGQTPVWEVLEFFGESVPQELENSRGLARDLKEVEKGRQLVERGTFGERGITKISTHYQCVDCHNVKSDAVGYSVSPEVRLEEIDGAMVMSQGSSFEGIVNREAWYNGIWGVKYGSYGEVFGVANQSLSKSVELCASICSQGRELAEYERELILAFFWSLQLTLSDLAFDRQDFELLETYKNKYENAVEEGSVFAAVLQLSAVQFLKDKYPQTSPAVPGSMELDITSGGNAENGRRVYEKACQHCHQEQAKHIKMPAGKGLAPLLKAYRNGILLHYVRNGTQRGSDDAFSYMPLFTRQRLSDGQVVDLAAYLREAGKDEGL